MDFQQSFQNAMNDIVQFVPRALAFLAILVIGWIVAKVVGKLVGKLLGRVGLDKMGERANIRRFTGKYELSDMLGKLVYFALLLFTLQFAFGAFGPNPVSSLLTSLVAWLPQLFVALLIVVVAFAIANAVHEMVANMLSRASYGPTLARIAQVAIVFIGAVAATSQAGIADSVTGPILWTVLAAVAGIAIVGVGGGLIGPMRERWERMLHNAEGETEKMKRERDSSKSADPTGESMGQTYTSGRYQAGDNLQTGDQPTEHAAAATGAERTRESGTTPADSRRSTGRSAPDPGRGTTGRSTPDTGESSRRGYPPPPAPPVSD